MWKRECKRLSGRRKCLRTNKGSVLKFVKWNGEKEQGQKSCPNPPLHGQGPLVKVFHFSEPQFPDM